MKEILITKHELDGYQLKVTRDTVQAKGYEQWVAVRYMDTNEMRLDACQWYVGLIKKGNIKQIMG